MENQTEANLEINLTRIAKYINRRTKGMGKIEIFYYPDHHIRFSLGDVVYITRHIELMEVLYRNENLYKHMKPGEGRIRMAYAILAKHISNHIWAFKGEKLYPEIK